MASKQYLPWFTLMWLLVPLAGHTAGSVTLAWDASPDPGITNYVVHYGTASGSYQNAVSSGTALTKTVSGLLNGTTYYFVVSAQSASGESGFSNEVSYRIPGTNAPPSISAIQDVSIVRGQAFPSVQFTVSDQDTPISGIRLSASSGNPTLVSDGSILITGTGTNWTLSLMVNSNQFGLTTIIIWANDDFTTVSRSFVLSVLTGPPGPPTNAVNFMGFTGNYSLDFGLHPEFKNVTTLSVAFWIWFDPTSDPYAAIISDIDHDINSGWAIKRNNTNNTLRILFWNKSPAPYIHTLEEISTNAWTHVSLVYDWPTGTIQVEFNGRLVQIVVNGPMPQFTGDTTTSLRMGSISKSADFLRGQLRDVVVVPRVLSRSELIQHRIFQPIAATYFP